MMLSPMSYDNLHANDTLEELIKERNRLIKEIKYFEKHKEELLADEKVMFPSPDVVYEMNVQYLTIICIFILGEVKCARSSNNYGESF